MTIQEAKDRVAEIRQIAYGPAYVIKQRVLYKDFIASNAAGTCEDPQRVAKILWDM